MSDPRGTVEAMAIPMTAATSEWHLCSDCGEVTELVGLPVADGFDPAERMCLRCGQARWVPAPAAATSSVASAAA